MYRAPIGSNKCERSLNINRWIIFKNIQIQRGGVLCNISFKKKHVLKIIKYVFCIAQNKTFCRYRAKCHFNCKVSLNKKPFCCGEGFPRKCHKEREVQRVVRKSQSQSPGYNGESSLQSARGWCTKQIVLAPGKELCSLEGAGVQTIWCRAPGKVVFCLQGAGVQTLWCRKQGNQSAVCSAFVIKKNIMVQEVGAFSEIQKNHHLLVISQGNFLVKTLTLPKSICTIFLSLICCTLSI